MFFRLSTNFFVGPGYNVLAVYALVVALVLGIELDFHAFLADDGFAGLCIQGDIVLVGVLQHVVCGGFPVDFLLGVAVAGVF